MCAEWAPKVRVIMYPLTWGGGSRNMFFLPTVPWRRKWQSTPVFLPGGFHGQRILVGYSPWGRTESVTTELTLHYVPGLPTLQRKCRECNFQIAELEQNRFSDLEMCCVLGSLHLLFCFSRYEVNVQKVLLKSRLVFGPEKNNAKNHSPLILF